MKEQPAKVVPLNLEVDLASWETPRNAGPPSVRSEIKQLEIKKQIDKLILYNHHKRLTICTLTWYQNQMVGGVFVSIIGSEITPVEV